MPGTVVVVQSGDLAAWVGAFSGLAGVVLGFGLDTWRRSHEDRQRLVREVEAASGQLFSAVAAVDEAARNADQGPPDSPWIQILVDRQAAVNAILQRIGDADSAEINKAARGIVAIAERGGWPAVPEGGTSNQKAQARYRVMEIGETMHAFNLAVLQARLSRPRWRRHLRLTLLGWRRQ